MGACQPQPLDRGHAAPCSCGYGSSAYAVSRCSEGARLHLADEVADLGVDLVRFAPPAVDPGPDVALGRLLDLPGLEQLVLRTAELAHLLRPIPAADGRRGEDERRHPLGMLEGEVDRHAAAVGRADHGRALDVRRVEQRNHVVDAGEQLLPFGSGRSP